MDKDQKTPVEFPRKVKVNGYSGYKANERPLSFILEREKIEVEEIIDRWYGVESDYFKVLGQDGMVYILKWHRLLDVWLAVKKMQDTRCRNQNAGTGSQDADRAGAAHGPENEMQQCGSPEDEKSGS